MRKNAVLVGVFVAAVLLAGAIVMALVHDPFPGPHTVPSIPARAYPASS